MLAYQSLKMGKPLINSVNGKKESMDAILPIAKKYGGAFVAFNIG